MEPQALEEEEGEEKEKEERNSIPGAPPPWGQGRGRREGLGRLLQARGPLCSCPTPLPVGVRYRTCPWEDRGSVEDKLRCKGLWDSPPPSLTGWQG